MSPVSQGGDFASGFLAGSVAKGLGSIGSGDFGIGGDSFGYVVSRVAIAGTIGGISSRAGGGDFWNGFQTGAFSRLFNTELPHGEIFKTIAHWNQSSSMKAQVEEAAFGLRPDNNVKMLEDFGDMAATGATATTATGQLEIAAPLTVTAVGFHMGAFYFGGNGESTIIDAISYGVTHVAEQVGMLN